MRLKDYPTDDLILPEVVIVGGFSTYERPDHHEIGQYLRGARSVPTSPRAQERRTHWYASNSIPATGYSTPAETDSRRGSSTSLQSSLTQLSLHDQSKANLESMQRRRSIKEERRNVKVDSKSPTHHRHQSIASSMYDIESDEDEDEREVTLVDILAAGPSRRNPNMESLFDILAAGPPDYLTPRSSVSSIDHDRRHQEKIEKARQRHEMKMRKEVEKAEKARLAIELRNAKIDAKNAKSDAAAAMYKERAAAKLALIKQREAEERAAWHLQARLDSEALWGVRSRQVNLKSRALST